MICTGPMNPRYSSSDISRRTSHPCADSSTAHRHVELDVKRPFAQKLEAFFRQRLAIRRSVSAG